MTVSRWAPDARERLETAALDLFVENGYQETTVAQIADRAGLNRATFFRHFADKREVLFGGEDVLTGLFADGIRAAAPAATVTECLLDVTALWEAHASEPPTTEVLAAALGGWGEQNAEPMASDHASRATANAMISKSSPCAAYRPRSDPAARGRRRPSSRRDG